MADPVTGQPPNDYLNRQQLVRSEVYGDTPLRTLLDTLLLDSVYAKTEDFDSEFDFNRWGLGRSTSADAKADVIGTATGHLELNTGGTNDSASWLYENQPRWQPRHRCLVQARLDIDNVTSLKFELGLLSAAIRLDNADIDGAVNVKATPTANTHMDAFNVAVYDTDDDTNLTLVQNLNGTLAAADQVGPATLASGTYTLLVALNEGGGALFWINGIKAGQVQGAPLDRSSGSGTMTPLGLADHADTASYGIWFFLQTRAAGIGHTARIDYIHARQDRQPIG